MKRNGRPRARGRELNVDMTVEQDIRLLPRRGRMGLFAWIERWRRRPRRVFWILDPATGKWREL
jgi:hypothetical protein